MFRVSEMEVEGDEDTVASLSVTETEDYPATADEDEDSKDQMSSRVKLPTGILHWPYVNQVDILNQLVNLWLYLTVYIENHRLLV